MPEFSRRLRVDQPAVYQIKLQGKLSDEWSNWFGGMTVTAKKYGEGTIVTTLSGPVADQAALYGLLSRLRDLGLPLLQVKLLQIGEVKVKSVAENPRYPNRLVLENVPRVGYDVHLSPFPGSLFAVLQYIGDPCKYDYIMGVSGAAFRRFWNRDDGGNIDISYLGEATFARTFEALGYDWQIIPSKKEAMILAVKESLSRRIPVISFGILGPPEAGIVTGYDHDGKVFLGWSYFQENGDRYYQKDDWFETMVANSEKGLILIGEKKAEKPPPRQILVRSLEWALDLENTAHRSNLPEHVAGLAAYDAWADAFEVDEDFPIDNREILNTRVVVHGDQCVMLEERHSAAQFLFQMVEVAPEAAEHLNAAAAWYQEVGNLTSRIYPWAPWHENVFKGLADPKIRAGFAQLVRLAKEKEAKAVVHLEQALAVLR